jgi:dTDP-4-amino-4,6-dideoxygalactose transaminase
VLRFQPPAYSPLLLSDVVAGIAGGDARPALRNDLTQRYAADVATLLGSGTMALGMAIRVAVSRRPGVPVAMPGFACYDLATAALMAQAPVVLYDVDPRTLAPDFASLQRVAASGLAGIVVVHPFGLPIPLGQLREMAQRLDALLIEDAAQGIGASIDERPAGSFGDLAVLSFGRGKGLTGGGGGALLARGAGAAAVADLPAVLGLDAGTASGCTYPDAATGARFAVKLAAQWALGRPTLYGLPARVPALKLGETLFHPPGPWLAMSAASARVVRRTHPASLHEAETRRRHAAYLIEALRGSSLQSFRAGNGHTPGWLRLPVLLPVGHRPHARADARLGVMPSYPRPLRALTELQPLLRAQPDTPGADRLARDLWTLPTHRLLTTRDLAHLATWVREASLGR